MALLVYSLVVTGAAAKLVSHRAPRLVASGTETTFNGVGSSGARRGLLMASDNDNGLAQVYDGLGARALHTSAVVCNRIV